MVVSPYMNDICPGQSSTRYPPKLAGPTPRYGRHQQYIDGLTIAVRDIARAGTLGSVLVERPRHVPQGMPVDVVRYMPSSIYMEIPRPNAHPCPRSDMGLQPADSEPVITHAGRRIVDRLQQPPSRDAVTATVRLRVTNGLPDSSAAIVLSAGLCPHNGRPWTAPTLY